MSKCAFPLWLLNNSHISFTLIKIKVLLPLLLLFSLHVTFTIFFPLQLLLPSHISEFSMLSLYPPSAFSPTVFLFDPLASLSLCHLAQARSSPLAMSHLSRFICRHVLHNSRILLRKMMGSIRLWSVAFLLTQ